MFDSWYWWNTSRFYSVRKRWSRHDARFLTLLWAANSCSWQEKKMLKWWKRVKICITTVLNVLPTSAQQIEGRISFPLHNNRLQHQKKEKFFQVQHKEMGGQDTFLYIKFWNFDRMWSKNSGDYELIYLGIYLNFGW